MRITNSMLSNLVLQDISSSYGRMEGYQLQLSSGKKYQYPSDNPAAVNQSLNIKSSLKNIDQYLSNINNGVSWLNTADSALRDAADLLHTAKELAVKGANATYSQDELNSMATEVDQLLGSMLDTANTSYAGRYIFAGFKTTTQPFTKVAGSPDTVSYNGDQGSTNYEIDQGVNVTINIPGSTVFKGSTDVFQTLINLRDHLRAGNYAAVSGDASQVDNALNAITSALSTVGTTTNRLDLTKNNLEQGQVNLSQILSNVEDADMPNVLVKLKTEQTVYQAALMTGSMVIQKSLIDFLT